MSCSKDIKFKTININTIPSGISVTINQKWIGNTPLSNVKMTKGVYQVDLSHKYYYPWSGSFEITQNTNFEIPLQVRSGVIEFKFNSKPDKLFIDNELITNKVLTLTLPFGNHKIMAYRKGMPLLNHEINVRSEKQISIQLFFQPDVNSGGFKVMTDPPGGAIKIAGCAFGNAPITLQGISEGSYLISAESGGFYPKETALRLAKKEQQNITIVLEPLPAILFLKTIPNDAFCNFQNLKIPDFSEKFIKEPSRSLVSLAPGSYLLEVTHGKYVPFVTNFSVTNNEQLVLNLPLQSKIAPRFLEKKRVDTGKKKITHLTSVNNRLYFTRKNTLHIDQSFEIFAGDYIGFIPTANILFNETELYQKVGSTLTYLAGGYGNANGKFRSINDAVADDQFVVVSDAFSYSISVFSRDFKFLYSITAPTILGFPENGVILAHSLNLHEKKLYFLEKVSFLIIEYDLVKKTGKVLRPTTEPTYTEAGAIRIYNGRLFVYDTRESSIFVYSLPNFVYNESFPLKEVYSERQNISFLGVTDQITLASGSLLFKYTLK